MNPCNVLVESKFFLESIAADSTPERPPVLVNGCNVPVKSILLVEGHATYFAAEISRVFVH